MKTSLVIKNGSQKNKKNIHSEKTIDIKELHSFVCPENQITLKENIGIHSIIEKKKLLITIVSNNEYNRLSELIKEQLTIQGKLYKININLSFIDIKIFRNILDNLQLTFNPSKQITLKQKILSLITIQNNLRDVFVYLRGKNFCEELCFESILHCNNCNNLIKACELYCVNNQETFNIKLFRGEIIDIIDLLPNWMYHKYKNLINNKNYNETLIIKSLLLNKNIINDDIKMNDDNEIKIDDIISNNNNNKIKKKMSIAFESDLGIELNIINDVMSLSAMPFIIFKINKYTVYI